MAAQLSVGGYTYSPADLIGHGSFADVFKGRAAVDGIVPKGTVVAIKRIALKRLKTGSAKRLLKTEIAILKVCFSFPFFFFL